MYFLCFVIAIVLFTFPLICFPFKYDLMSSHDIPTNLIVTIYSDYYYALMHKYYFTGQKCNTSVSTDCVVINIETDLPTYYI